MHPDHLRDVRLAFVCIYHVRFCSTCETHRLDSTLRAHAHSSQWADDGKHFASQPRQHQYTVCVIEYASELRMHNARSTRRVREIENALTSRERITHTHTYTASSRKLRAAVCRPTIEIGQHNRVVLSGDAGPEKEALGYRTTVLQTTTTMSTIDVQLRYVTAMRCAHPSLMCIAHNGATAMTIHVTAVPS